MYKDFQIKFLKAADKFYIVNPAKNRSHHIYICSNNFYECCTVAIRNNNIKKSEYIGLKNIK